MHRVDIPWLGESEVFPAFAGTAVSITIGTVYALKKPFIAATVLEAIPDTYVGRFDPPTDSVSVQLTRYGVSDKLKREHSARTLMRSCTP